MGETGPRTLAVDVGGTGLKAVVLSPDGEMTTERVRHDTPYPCPPPVLLDALQELATTQPEYDRVSVGFPGAIRRGRVREVPAFSRRKPGAGPDPALVAQWSSFDLQSALEERFGRPTRVANDADVQGCAVVAGQGLELVITLGTGVGTAVFFDGALLPHMELSHGRFAEGLSIEVACGDHHREKIGTKAWRKLVASALDTFEEMVLPDHLYIGGGNAKRLDPESLGGPNRSIVPNISGLLGGIKLWERAVGAASLGEVPLPAKS
jgi:polyphosphate glucokinase